MRSRDYDASRQGVVEKRPSSDGVAESQVTAAGRATELQTVRVLLHDAEQFIDRRHTNKAEDPDCQACGLVARLRSMSERLAREINRG